MKIARISNTIPITKILNIIPNIRISSFQTGRAGELSLIAGTPIGLLLALTYTNPNLGNYGDFRPNVRIITT